MAGKILAKDAKINSIYLTKGGKQADVKGVESLWGFYPVRVIKKVTKDDNGEIQRVIVFTPWQTELDLAPDYPLEVTDLQTLPSADHFNVLIKTTKISTEEEAPSGYVEKLKDIKKEEQAPESKQRNHRDTILEELEKGTPIKKIAEMTGMVYQNVYGAVLQLKKKGYKIQKVGKGTFQIVK